MPSFTPPTFDELIALATEHTLEAGWHLPMVFAVGTRNVAVMIIEMPSDLDDRHNKMYFIGHQASREAIGMLRDVYLVMESWMSRPKPGESELSVRPSLDPNRIEMLILGHYELRIARLDLVAFEMIRDAEGTLIDLVKTTDTRSDESDIRPESVLVEAFIDGYMDGRKGRLPRVGGPRG